MWSCITWLWIRASSTTLRRTTRIVAAVLRAKLKSWRAGLNAEMPQPNPNWDRGMLDQRAGLVGCSAAASGPCLED